MEAKEAIEYLKREREDALAERDRALANERRLCRAISLMEHAYGAALGALLAARAAAENEEFLNSEVFDKVIEAAGKAHAAANSICHTALPSATE